jgi:hypothetical protein
MADFLFYANAHITIFVIKGKYITINMTCFYGGLIVLIVSILFIIFKKK